MQLFLNKTKMEKKRDKGCIMGPTFPATIKLVFLKGFLVLFKDRINSPLLGH